YPWFHIRRVDVCPCHHYPARRTLECDCTGFFVVLFWCARFSHLHEHRVAIRDPRSHAGTAQVHRYYICNFRLGGCDRPVVGSGRCCLRWCALLCLFTNSAIVLGRYTPWTCRLAKPDRRSPTSWIGRSNCCSCTSDL